MSWLRYLLIDMRIAWHYFRLDREYRKNPTALEELQRLREWGL